MSTTLRTMTHTDKPVANDQQQESINWNTTIFMVIFHLGAVAALFMFSWPALIATLVLWWVSGSLGIGMGFHRLLTHRGFKTPKAVEYFLTFCGALALEGGAINWVVTHRIQHAHTDAAGDPHTPRDGRWCHHLVCYRAGPRDRMQPVWCYGNLPD